MGHWDISLLSFTHTHAHWIHDLMDISSVYKFKKKKTNFKHYKKKMSVIKLSKLIWTFCWNEVNCNNIEDVYFRYSHNCSQGCILKCIAKSYYKDLFVCGKVLYRILLPHKQFF